jgi:hypothetical protein
MTYRHSAVLCGALVLAVATSGVVAQQDVRIVQDTGTVQVNGPAGIGGPGGRTIPMPMGTGLIFGQALDAGSTRPVPGALITLVLSGATPIRALADSQGRFAFLDLPKGRFNISATKAGYVDGAYGRTRPGGPTLSLDLADGEKVGTASVSLWKYAAIAGTIVDEQGEPVVNATVRVLKHAVVGGQWKYQNGPSDTTDDRGAYRIGLLEPGEYIVAVPMGQNEPMQVIERGPEVMRDVMTVASVRVAAAGAAGGGGGNLTFVTGAGDGPNAGMSEDGHPLAYPTQFYPAAPSSARAAAITVGSGDERTGIDFQLKPVRTVKVAGMAMGPDGPMGGLQLTLAPAEATDLVTSIETMTAISGEGGAFNFTAVPAGQYILRSTKSPRVMFTGPGETTVLQMNGQVMVTRSMVTTGAGAPPLPTEPTLWTEMTMAVGNTDINDLAVSLRPGLKVSGSLQFDGVAVRPASDQLSSIAVSLEAADAKPGAPPNARGRVESSGTFSTVGVPPGRYFVRVNGAPQGWTFRGATMGGRDVTDTPLEIESGDVNGVMLSFTDRPTQLSGNVTTDNGSPEGATVIVFPADPSGWVGYGSQPRRLRTVRADKTGSYSIQNLPAGDYYAAAVPDKMAADWQNPKFLEGLTTDATRVRIGDGEQRTLNVKVVSR